MKRKNYGKTPWIGWWLLPLVLAGCGHSAKVTGKVTYRARPLCYGAVTLFSADKTARSGVIEPDGSYAVEGVPRGETKIAVISRDPAKGRSATRGQKPGGADKKGTSSQGPAVEGWVPLPAQYEMPGTSGLRCNVDSGAVRYDIKLK